MACGARGGARRAGSTRRGAGRAARAGRCGWRRFATATSRPAPRQRAAAGARPGTRARWRDGDKLECRCQPLPARRQRPVTPGAAAGCPRSLCWCWLSWPVGVGVLPQPAPRRPLRAVPELGAAPGGFSRNSCCRMARLRPADLRGGFLAAGAVSKIALSQLSPPRASVLLRRVPELLPNPSCELAPSHRLPAGRGTLGGPSGSTWQRMCFKGSPALAFPFSS